MESGSAITPTVNPANTFAWISWNDGLLCKDLLSAESIMARLILVVF
jgi:hypothetical protein